MEKFRGNGLLKYYSSDELEKVFKIDDLYEKAFVIVCELFKDKVDKAGGPYIGHLCRVSDRLDDELEKVAGLLHDTFEDTDVNYEDLLQIGFSKEILDVVMLVTKNKNDTFGKSCQDKLESYYAKIDSIIDSGNLHAIRLKYADMSDNYDEDRLRCLSSDMQEWFHKKYGTSLVKLKNKLDMIEEDDRELYCRNFSRK